MGRYFNKVPTINKRFKNFNIVIRSPHDFELKIKKYKGWKKAAKIITSKKGLGVIGVGATGAGLGVFVTNYIKDNSGCFMYDQNDKIICKVKEYSCCNSNDVVGVPNCNSTELMTVSNACENYDSTSDVSCCRKCDCQFNKCPPNHSLKCRIPTAGEAFTYAAEQTSEAVSSAVKGAFNIFSPFVKPLLIGVIVILGILFFGKILWK